MKLSITWNYTLHSLTKLNSAASGVEGDAWLDLGCSCHGGEEEEQLGQKSRGIYEILVPRFCHCQRRRQGMERNRPKGQPYERGQGSEAVVTFFCLLFLLSLLSVFDCLHFFSSVWFTVDKPQHTWLWTSVYLATAPEDIFFCLLKEGNFPPSLLAQLPAVALLPFIINQKSSRGIFFAKRGPEWTEKRLKSGQISKWRWAPRHSEG